MTDETKKQLAELEGKEVDIVQSDSSSGSIPPNSTLIEASQITVVRSGPLPPPEELERYEIIVPGVAKEIVDFARREQEHRHSMDRKQSFRATFGRVAGVLSALIISLAVLSIALYAIANDKAWIGLGTMLLALASLVGVFVAGKRAQTKAQDQDD